MKRHFLTGLAIILPLVVTLKVIFFLASFLTSPFLGMTEAILTFISDHNGPLQFLHTHAVIGIISELLILTFLFGLTVFVGFLGKGFLLNQLIAFGESLIHKIPVANKIYLTVKEMLHSIFSQQRQDFSKVAEVPFPHSTSSAIGFITNKGIKIPGGTFDSVYIPGTPNPMMGFLLLYPENQVKTPELPVEDAVKFIVSCGVVAGGATEKR